MASEIKSSFDPRIFLAKPGEGRSVGAYRKAKIVYSQGAPANAVYYIRSGKVKVAVVSKEGREAVISLLGENDFFGESCLSGPPYRIATVTTLTDSVIVKIEKATILRALQQEPSFAEMFISHLLARKIRVESDLVDQLLNSSEKRLARLLLLLANYGTESEAEHITTDLSQETLADMIGTTRSRVSYFMNKFRKLGFIEYKDGITVNRSLLNAILLDNLSIRDYSFMDDGLDEPFMRDFPEK
ncbi:Crp/Fnr family transcriptional regulator [Blastochloris sulfoviridis]|uniref:Crp/Fnr family transcriptional regulator n=1 Tax=Blastochloris sulfoviridis TaxID=50712 RepID=A0A5M6HN76_9HYPH|nr:Crp/Fnr family transcriptional regulator [Blastochloris sulfoviridis]KAA5597296.1 Crp/Fnr family transcriptional regulator [Blastochloris sulfoviridis]